MIRIALKIEFNESEKSISEKNLKIHQIDRIIISRITSVNYIKKFIQFGLSQSMNFEFKILKLKKELF